MGDNQNLITGNIFWQLIKLASPIMFGMLIFTLYLMTDLWFVGRLGPEAITALSISSNVFFFQSVWSFYRSFPQGLLLSDQVTQTCLSEIDPLCINAVIIADQDNFPNPESIPGTAYLVPEPHESGSPQDLGSRHIQNPACATSFTCAGSETGGIGKGKYTNNLSAFFICNKYSMNII